MNTSRQPAEKSLSSADQIRCGAFIAAVCGAVAAGAVVGPHLVEAVVPKDYGCATATIDQDGTVVSAAQEAAQQLAPGHKNAVAAATYAAQEAPHAAQVDVGDPVTTCLHTNVIAGYGTGGWVAQVRVG